MNTAGWIISTALEIFLLLSVAIGTILGRLKLRGFAIGTTACILIGAPPPSVSAMPPTYAVGNVVLTVLVPIIVAATFSV